jgi:hypothetical protein
MEPHAYPYRMPHHCAYAMRLKIRRRVPLDVVLVEEDPREVLLADFALEETQIRHRLRVLSRAEDLLPYLRREGKFAAGVLPDVILLGAKPDAARLLPVLTREAAAHGVPVILLTDMHPPKGVWPSDYMLKPCSGEKLLEAFGRLHSVYAA